MTLKVTRASLANIEAGRQRIQLHTLLDIAAALEVDVSALLAGRADAGTGVDLGPFTEKLSESAQESVLAFLRDHDLAGAS